MNASNYSSSLETRVVRVIDTNNAQSIPLDTGIYTQLATGLGCNTEPRTQLVLVDKKVLTLENLEKALRQAVDDLTKITLGVLIIDLNDADFDVWSLDRLLIASGELLKSAAATLPRDLVIVLIGVRKADTQVSIVLAPASAGSNSTTGSRIEQILAESSAELIVLPQERNEARTPLLRLGKHIADSSRIENDWGRWLESNAIGPDSNITQAMVRENIDLVFGHFALESSAESTPIHSNIVVSVSKAASNAEFVAGLRRALVATLGEDFLIHPFGTDADINRLALGVSGGASPAPFGKIDRALAVGRNVAIFCDILSRRYPLESIYREYLTAGARSVTIFGLCTIEGDAADSIPGMTVEDWTVRLPFHDSIATNCDSCAHESPVIRVTRDTFLQDIVHNPSFGSLQDDPYLFWTMLASVPESLRVVVHWTSDRTRYHYQARVMCQPLFEEFGFSIASRIRNQLRGRGIKASWIDRIVCVKETEGSDLARRLCDVLGMTQEHLIEIDRHLLPTTPLDAVESFSEGWRSQYGTEPPDLKGKNIVVVDQAAHHFNTFQAIQWIGHSFDATILAYVVFIDRIAPRVELDSYLLDSHSLAIYRWPVPPFLDFECPCTASRRR